MLAAGTARYLMRETCLVSLSDRFRSEERVCWQLFYFRNGECKLVVGHAYCLALDAHLFAHLAARLSDLPQKCSEPGSFCLRGPTTT